MLATTPGTQQRATNHEQHQLRQVTPTTSLCLFTEEYKGIVFCWYSACVN